MTEPDWIAALRTRPGMRLLRSWGEGDARVGAFDVRAGWRDDGTFVAVDGHGDRRCVELDPRTGAHRALRVGDGQGSLALMRGARAVVRARVVEDGDRTELEVVSLPGLATLRRWAVDGYWVAWGASARDVVLAEVEEPTYLFTRPGGRVAVVPVGEGRPQELALAGTARAIVDGGRWIVTAQGAELTCWDVGARAPVRRTAVEGVGEIARLSAFGEAQVRALGGGLEARWNVVTGELSVLPERERGEDLTARARDGVDVQVSYSGRVSWSREGVALDVREAGPCKRAWVSPDLDHVVVTDGRALGVVSRRGAAWPGGWPSDPGALAWSDDGRLLAVIDAVTSRVLDAGQGRELWALEYGDYGVEAGACFDRAGRSLYAVGAWDVVGWDLARGVEVFRHSLESVGPASRKVEYTAIACSAEGDRAVACCPWVPSSVLLMIEGERVWEEVPPAPAVDGPVSRPSEARVEAAGFDARGRLVVVENAAFGSYHRVLRRSRDGSWETLRQEGYDLGRGVSLRDGALLVCGFYSRVEVIEIEGWRERRVDCERLSSPYAAGARTLVAVRPGGEVLVRVDLATGKTLDAIDLSGAVATVERVAMSYDERRVAVSLSTGVVLAFDAP